MSETRATRWLGLKDGDMVPVCLMIKILLPLWGPETLWAWFSEPIVALGNGLYGPYRALICGLVITSKRGQAGDAFLGLLDHVLGILRRSERQNGAQVLGLPPPSLPDL
ncbi:hypothetical protein NDU88_002035 [Pleurodeles waltl]|uniref:Uncharacterized protein n=1 Tax=Pleurodeles waltl TaxID=8319 RepID=A0AAV7RAS3_PLEWA|nr:hypothetical protein NDU88_002035 [Pleurodeles waltl]